MALIALIRASYFMSLMLLMYSLCTLQQATSSYSVGPWGGSGGKKWAFEPNGLISHISISYDGGAVHSISFTSQDAKGHSHHSGSFGSSKGTQNVKIDIDVNSEKINNISGTFGTYQSAVVITSLSFSTDSNKVFGPFGAVTGTYFSVPVLNGSIIGFYGHCSSLLDSIGVSSISSGIVGPWGGKGGDPWTYLPRGPISRISITHDDSINNIMFTSKNADGTLLQSPKFGVVDGTQSEVIDIDVNVEKFNGISGTYGFHGDIFMVTSVSFSTDTGKVFGPFGYETGTTFSLPIENGYISGFHGRAGALVDSIGVYITST